VSCHCESTPEALTYDHLLLVLNGHWNLLVAWTQEVVEVEEHTLKMKQVGVVEVLVLLKSIQMKLTMVTLLTV
jgi:hypothetical protein